jgi:DNA polymerase delta subunit 1
MVQFQALSWESCDSEDDTEHLISIFGRTEQGMSVCVTSSFKPYFFVKVPERVQPGNIFENVKKSVKGNIESYEVVKSKDLWGFQNNEKSLFVKLTFKTLKHSYIATVSGSCAGLVSAGGSHPTQTGGRDLQIQCWLSGLRVF